MAKKVDVGRSSRTPVKHYLLDAILGKVCGVLSKDSPRVPCRASFLQPLVCVDLCGGDGLKTDDHDASPLIMYRHCEWLCGRGKKATLDVLEYMPNTFEQLTINCGFMSESITTFTMGDARQYALPSLSSNQAAFVHCDPNSVDQIPLTKPFLSSFNKYTTYLVTLGCNVSGIKMLSKEKRSVWFEYVEMIISVLPSHHDAVLFWLNRDDAQWAYLLSIPNVWSAEFTADMVAKTSRIWVKGVLAVSYRSSRECFNDRLKQLFLTKEEYGNT